MNRSRMRCRSRRSNGISIVRRGRSRDGSAVTEFALVAPLLALILLGAIDVGQAINVSQVVNDASREGARWATRADVKTSDEVVTAVNAYLARCFPGVGEGGISSAAKVSVLDDVGTVAGGDLTTIPSGEAVSVQVNLDYAAVRWMVGFAGLTGQSMSTTTVMRRE